MNNTNEAIITEPFSLGDIPMDVLCVSGLMTLLMFGFWIMRYRQSGVLTFDVFFCFMFLYMPIGLMAVFSYSPLNATVSTGDWHWEYMPYLRESFYVSVFGAAVFLATAAVTSRWDSAPPGYRLVYRALHEFWGTKPGLTILLGGVAIFGGVTIVTTGFTGSREHFMTHTELRPTAHLFSAFAVLGMYMLLIGGYCRQSWKHSAMAAGLAVAMLGFGTRKVTVGTMLYYSAVRLINSRSRRIIAAACCSFVAIFCLVFLGLAVEAVRAKEVSVERITSAHDYLLFGNNFSEIRDFAWMLSAWDRKPLMGTTYCSGLLAWIPSFLFPARKEMSWGVFSTHMTGLDGAGHPGLRPTIFGEAYFNFGVVGVLVFGLLLGGLFGRTAAFAERTLHLADPRKRAFRLLCTFLYFEFFLRFQQSANYFQSYVDLVMLTTGLVGATVLARLRVTSGRSLPAVGSAVLTQA